MSERQPPKPWGAFLILMGFDGLDEGRSGAGEQVAYRLKTAGRTFDNAAFLHSARAAQQMGWRGMRFCPRGSDACALLPGLHVCFRLFWGEGGRVFIFGDG